MGVVKKIALAGQGRNGKCLMGGGGGGGGGHGVSLGLWDWSWGMDV